MEEKQIEQKEEWKEAEMINRADGEKASQELKELIVKNIKEQKSLEEIEKELKEQYIKKK